MPHFYLHVRDGAALIEDPDGEALPDLDAARQEALESARFLVSEKVRVGAIIGDQRIEIADEVGTVLAVVPIKDALRLA